MKGTLNGWKWSGVVVLVVAASGIFYLWYQDNHIFEWRLSLDGLITLAGGVLAFFAVMAQIRGERIESRKERERRKSSIAKAILFEIDYFYRWYLRNQRKYFEQVDADNDELAPFKSVGPNQFAVYNGNAGSLGDLDDYTVAAIVQFYGGAEGWVSAIQTYGAAVEHLQRHENVVSEEAVARELLKNLKEVFPKFIRLTWVACHLLCEVADLRFENLSIGSDFPTLPPDPNADVSTKNSDNI